MISLSQVGVSFGGFSLFQSVSLRIAHNDKIGLVGRNGAGKSTLLKIIARQAEPSEGEITIAKDKTIAYLPQHIKFTDSYTVVEDILRACGHIYAAQKELESLQEQLALSTDYESESYMQSIEKITELHDFLQLHGAHSLEGDVEQMLIGIGFNREDFTKKTSEFSGGWRMRIELVKLLIQQPDVLLLDEPTNHLDILSIHWLENFLKSYKGAIILISHDRRFLDAITHKTCEIALQTLTSYPVAYSQYIIHKAERAQLQQAAYENQQKKIADTEKFIERFRYKASKATQVQSRIKQLDKLDRVEVEPQSDASYTVAFPPTQRAGAIVLKAENITKSYSDHTVLKNVNFIVERSQKIALLGKNGEGKSTLIKCLLQSVEHSGTVVHGHNVRIGYFAQNQDEILDEQKTVLETLDEIAVGEVRTKIRDILGAFFFSGDEVDKKVAVLSGGERNRLAMAKLMLEPYNVLILDEPTNHLDIQSKAVLKQALIDFDGTLILVSHDRDFLEGLATHIYEVKHTSVKECVGTLDDFLKSYTAMPQDSKPAKQPETDSSSQKIEYEQRKEYEREIRRIENKVKQTEEHIFTLESAISELEQKFSDAQDSITPEDYSQHESLQKELLTATILWEELINDLEIKKKL